MFTEESFEVFQIEGLDNRMAAIRAEIQPVFQSLGDYAKENLEPILETELFVHIAQHRRRTVYAPENTWSALSQKKRGYKMEPHFQLGIWPDYVFVRLSLIDQPKNQTQIAEALLAAPELFTALPDDYTLSLNHTVNQLIPVNAGTIEQGLTRLRDVKKGEFEIGRIIPNDSPLLGDEAAQQQFILKTYQELLPIYQLALSQQK